VLPNVRVGNNVVLKRVVIDRGCEIKEGMEIGVDAAHDRRRFYVTENGITLVTADMLRQSIYSV
jgi:glucose-1-phosphate adenylyltransferase